LKTLEDVRSDCNTSPSSTTEFVELNQRKGRLQAAFVVMRGTSSGLVC
jgi:hypothetical protein